jgi:hypothetical protein
MGAASIASVINAVGSRNFPFVFGGDGATMLIPGVHLEKVTATLKVTQAIAIKNYDINLRIGAVPVKLLNQNSAEVLCAKHEVTTNNYLAVLKGSGLTLAEKWIKKGGPNGEDFSLAVSDSVFDLKASDKAHSGLSCRWQPQNSKNGVIAALVVVASESVADKAELFKNVLSKITANVGQISDASLSPVQADRMQAANLRAASTKEANLSGKKGTGYLIRWVSVYIQIIIAIVLVKTNAKLGSWSAEGYKDEISRNTDHQKFDESLKMILDCSKEQAAQIRTSLEQLEKQGLITFGMHLSSQAIMTCYVDSPFDNQHVHFVDGADGGYTLAASEIKAKFKK